MRTRLLLPVVICALVLTHGTFALEIPLSVEEPADVDRLAEPVTSGVPLPPGTQTSSWSLWDGNTQVPVQTTPMQGTTPWILLDFQVEVAGKGTQSLILKDTAPSASPAEPLTISENTSQIEVTTGPLKVVVGKSIFNLFESVWLDRNDDGTFAASEQIVGSSGSNITVLDATSGVTFSGTGVPDLLEWEYSGPLRATLRVDGRYRSGNSEFIAYTTRLTFFAGRTDVKIEHILRNSYQPNERHVKVQSATLKIGAAAASLSLACSGYENVNGCNGPNVHWANVDSAGLSFDLVPSQWDSNGGIVVPDLSRHGAKLVVDFAEDLSATEQQRRADTANSPLFARASPLWYSEYGELSASRFSTLDDEKQSYQLWGWSWTPDQLPDDDHKPNYWISWKTVDVHDFSESDDLWQNLIMFVRTGSRGYFDRTLAWARYYKWEYAFRTDGFDYAWDSNYESPSVERPEIPIPLTAQDTSYLNNDVGIGRVDILNWGADHLWGWGLVDYYYLTGDLESLEAVADLVEVVERANGHRTPGSTNTGKSLRRYARALILTTRFAQAVPESRWIDAREHMADLWRQSPDWDDRGFSGNADDCSPTAVSYSTFQIGVTSHAFDLYYTVTGDPIFRERLIQMAEWQKEHGLDLSCNSAGTGSRVTTDCPVPNQVTHNSCSKHHQIWLVDTIARGYRFTEDPSFLERAKLHWDQGSKASGAGPDEVGRFVNYRFDSGGNFYPSNGDLPYAALLFYDVVRSFDETPPTPPANLDATAQNDSQIQLSWSAAVDPDSGISRYVVYRDGSAIAEPSVTSFTDVGLSESTTYAYQVSAVNGAGMESETSGIASATTLGDSSPPLLVGASSVGDPTKVFVSFSEPVELASSTTTSNYSIDNGITVLSASLGTDLETVTLTTSSHVDGTLYSLTVNNVKDRANTPNTIPADSQVSYTFSAPLVVSILSVASGEPYQVVEGLGSGDQCYIDRNYTYSNLPGNLLGSTYIMTANDDKASQGESFLTFSVNQNVKVYVAHDDRKELKPEWLDDFVDTGVDLTTSAPHSLFVKNFPAGDVVLGGNIHPSDPGGHNMYTVVILAESVQITLPPDPTGLQVH